MIIRYPGIIPNYSELEKIPNNNAGGKLNREVYNAEKEDQYMDTITIMPICGLYQEFYSPASELLIHPELEDSTSGELDANSIFWSEALSYTTVTSVLERVAEHLHLKDIPIAYKAVAADPEAFLKRVLSAKMRVADQGISPQDFFSYIETLNIYCALYAKIKGDGELAFQIQSGWILQENSTEVIFESCLDLKKNPYLEFINTSIMPLLKKLNPKIVFFAGRPSYFSFAIARLLKSYNPAIFICSTRHSSEYYSLNKIDFLLKNNVYFFRAYDAVILDHFRDTEQELADAIKHKKSICDIGNLIFRAEHNCIQHTGYRTLKSNRTTPIIQKRPLYTEGKMSIDPSRIVNVHLFPDIKCYWNKCSFCGINRKYHFDNPHITYQIIDRQLSKLKDMLQGASYVWFIDEAIPPDTLGKIAELLVREYPGIAWQARCRIEKDLLAEGLPEMLKKSGLCELRLGLESGSYSVLKRMNKFDDSFTFSTVEEICQRYSSCGISIHFPIIVGFPGETEEDRRATYQLLRRLTEKYKGVTFNINLFGLDIGSKVFSKWWEFDVQELSFPCDPRFYLGNILQWRSQSIDMKRLAVERDQFMREILYSWMPAHTFTPPHIFYRLSETIRNTLVWKKSGLWPRTPDANNASQRVGTGDISIIYEEAKEVSYIYSWNSHHFMIGNDDVVNLIQAFKKPGILGEVLKTFCEKSGRRYCLNDLMDFTYRLLCDQYLQII